MTGKVHDHTEQPIRLVPGTDDADFRINRAGVADDVRVASAGMTPGHAAVHPQAAVEGDFTFVARTEAASRGHAKIVREADRVHNRILYPLQVAQIRRGRFFVSQVLHEWRRMIKFSGQNHSRRPR